MAVPGYARKKARPMPAVEFLERDAFDLRLGGRYSLANRRDLHGNRREFACRTSRVSPQQMMIAVPVIGAVGERVISYFGEFGKLDGLITDVVEGGFLLDLVVTKARREQLVSKLTWLDRQQREAVVDVRATERVVPENPHSTIVLADGSTTSCFVIDMSATGAAVSSELQPEIGTPLAVGRAVGRVIRHFAEGFAVKFVEQQQRERLERMVIRGW
jgi:PilZ domain